ncbi:T9SS type A sorting domain-containing protein [Luteibaculum oceani]|uniref:T9SS type A sorting domain-containing protein n=1 Tax=Luteibaculum oceani TaxID=1294296 RepID=A0A5C6V4W0_9FLAO|nr:T9SS type A sorting domain-containing protein [Luteibaculum oceani]TXC78585.1 T9SS type A sorting domain-containing protein [Luteibaculum oceani]
MLLKDYFKFSLILIFLFQIDLSKAQTNWLCSPPSGEDRGMYVNDFIHNMRYSYGFTNNGSQSPSTVIFHNEDRADFDLSILGNPDKENALLFYAEKNQIDYLILYNTSGIFRYENSHLLSKYEDLLADFIQRAGPDIRVGLSFGPEFTEFEGGNYDEAPSDGFSQGGGTPPGPPIPEPPISGDPENPTEEPAINLNELESGNTRVSKVEIIEALGGDTLFDGWPILQDIMTNTPDAELTINHEIYALSRMYSWVKHARDNVVNDDVKVPSEATTGGDDDEENPLPGGNYRKSFSVPFLVTEYEWWHIDPNNGVDYSNREKKRQDEVFKNGFVDKIGRKRASFKSILQAMYAFRTGDNSIVDQIYVYQGYFPKDVNDVLNDSAGYPPLYFDWAGDIINWSDRVLAVNYTNDPSKIGFDEPYLILHELFAKQSKVIRKKYDFTNLLSAQNGHFYDHKRETNYAPAEGIGTFLSRKYSIARVEGLARYAWDSLKTENRFSDDYDANYFKYKGSAWFSYQIMPYPFYKRGNTKSDNRIQKGGTKSIVDLFHNYYTNNSTAIDFEVYYVDDGVDEALANTDSRKFDIYSTRDFDIDTTKMMSFSNKRFSLPPDNKYYYLEHEDDNSCKFTSVPVGVFKYNNDLYIRDFEKGDSGGENQPRSKQGVWKSPDISITNTTFTSNNVEREGYGPTGRNKVRVTIHNKKGGQDYYYKENTYRLDLFWTLFTPGSPWPLQWINNRRPSDGKIVGDRINITPIYLNKDIPAGRSETFVYEWDPSEFGIDPTIDPDPHICITARLVRSENPSNSYGMTYQEQDQYDENAFNNNSYAYKNVRFINNGSVSGTASSNGNLINDDFQYDAGNEIEIPDFTSSNLRSSGRIYFSNTKADTSFHRLDFNLQSNSNGKTILDYGRVFMELNGSIYDKWKQGNMRSSGIQQIGGIPDISERLRLLEITNNAGFLDSMLFFPFEFENFRLLFLSDTLEFGLDTVEVQFKQSSAMAGTTLSSMGGASVLFTTANCPAPKLDYALVNSDGVITISNSGEFSNASFTWYSGDSLLTNDSLSYLIPHDSGSFFVEASFTHGCISRSDTITILEEEPGSIVIDRNSGAPTKFLADMGSESEVEDGIEKTEIYRDNFLDSSSLRNQPEEDKGELYFSVFPNPVSDVIRVVVSGTRLNEDFTVNIFDVNGKLVMTKHVNETKVGDKTVTNMDVSNMEPSSYLIKVVTEQGQIKSMPIIKK